MKILGKEVNPLKLDLVYGARTKKYEDVLVFCSHGKEKSVKVDYSAEKRPLDEVKDTLEEAGFDWFARIHGAVVNLNKLEYIAVTTLANDCAVEMTFNNNSRFRLCTGRDVNQTIENYNSLVEQYNSYHEYHPETIQFASIPTRHTQEENTPALQIEETDDFTQ